MSSDVTLPRILGAGNKIAFVISFRPSSNAGMPIPAAAGSSTR
jgi:hypothetical protein